MGYERGLSTERPVAGAGARPAADDDWALVAALGSGDEAAFLALVERHHPSLLRLARLYMPEGAAAGLAQAAWGALLADLDGTERTSSLRVTLFRMIIDAARRQRPAGARALPFAAHPDPLTDL